MKKTALLLLFRVLLQGAKKGADGQSAIRPERKNAGDKIASGTDYCSELVVP
jgi:hypothetical protein